MGSGDEYDDELDLMSVDQDVQTPTVSKTELDKPPSPQPTDTHMKVTVWHVALHIAHQ